MTAQYCYLAEACENTFIIIDSINSESIDQEFLNTVHQYLIKENRDDALILVNDRQEKDVMYVKMLVLGADKVLAEFCGNGARACAAYLFNHYSHFKKFYIKWKNKYFELLNNAPGIYSAELSLANFAINPNFITRSDIFNLHQECFSFFHEGKEFFYVEVMEPHLVINEDMNTETLFAWGKRINQLTHLFPQGINVNSYTLLPDQSIRAHTYERGVQRLTRSCGTGASSIVSLYLKQRGKQEGTISVMTPGGKLQVTVTATHIQLQGAASINNSINK